MSFRKIAATAVIALAAVQAASASTVVTAFPEARPNPDLTDVSAIIPFIEVNNYGAISGNLSLDGFTDLDLFSVSAHWDLNNPATSGGLLQVHGTAAGGGEFNYVSDKLLKLDITNGATGDYRLMFLLTGGTNPGQIAIVDMFGLGNGDVSTAADVGIAVPTPAAAAGGIGLLGLGAAVRRVRRR